MVRPLSTWTIARQAGAFRLISQMFWVTVISTPFILMIFANGDVEIAWGLFLVWWPGLLMFALLPVLIVLLAMILVTVGRFFERGQSSGEPVCVEPRNPGGPASAEKKESLLL